MDARLEEKGIWWLPDNPEKRVSGTIRFVPDEGTYLEVVGDLGIGANSNSIHGQLSDGRAVTLRKAFTRNITYSGGAPPATYFANRTYIGAHYAVDEEVTFEELKFRASYLSGRAGSISGFEKFEIPEGKGVDLKYRRPTGPRASLTEKFDLRVAPRANFSSPGPADRSTSIQQDFQLVLEASEELPFERFDELRRHIVNFLTFAVSEPVHPLELIGKSSKRTEAIREDRERKRPVHLLFPIRNYSEPEEEKHPRRMLFSYGDIADRFETMASSWVKQAEQLGPAMDLYFSVQYEPDIPTDREFLSLVQALEVLHRRSPSFSNREIPEDEHDERIKNINKYTKRICGLAGRKTKVQ